MEDAIFIDSNGLCKRTNVYPDSIFYIIQDSLITVPNSMGDQITQQLSQYVGNKTTISLRDKGLRGISERYIEDYVDMRIEAGDSVYVGGVLKVGPQTISLKPKNIIKIKSKSS